MKAWYIKTEGHENVLQRQDVEVPQPGQGEILVRVRASSCNRGEFIAGHGLHKAGAARPAGMEAAGEVEAVGAGVTTFHVGDRVTGRTQGGFAEYTVMPAHQAMRVPPNLTWEQAAAIPLVYLTAYDILHTCGQLVAGEWLLVAGASSGVGVASIQLGKLAGADVIGTSGSTEKLEQLKKYGLSFGIATRRPDFSAQVMTITNDGGANIAVNLVGGSVFPELLKSLAYQGRVAICGYVDGVVENNIDLAAVHEHRLRVYGVSNKRVPQDYRAAAVRAFSRDILPAFASGRIAPVIDRVFGFDELPAAKARMESNQQIGKIVVSMR